MGSKPMSVTDEQFLKIQSGAVDKLSRAAELAEVFNARTSVAHSPSTLFADQSDMSASDPVVSSSFSP